MIPSRRSAWFARWFARDAERRLGRSFEAIRVRGLASLGATVAAGPTLVVTNHTAWWDPLVALFVAVRLLDADAHAMMDARNLERLPFFGKVGAFGVDLADPADGARAIRYAARLLSGPRRLVWIFGQGREVPITVRALGFRCGSAEFARVARAKVVPGALRYELGATPDPVLWLSFGEPIEPIRDVARGHLVHEEHVGAELDRIDRAITAGVTDGFETIRAKRPAAGLALAQALLAWLTRPRPLAG